MNRSQLDEICLFVHSTLKMYATYLGKPRKSSFFGVPQPHQILPPITNVDIAKANVPNFPFKNLNGTVGKTSISWEVAAWNDVEYETNHRAATAHEDEVGKLFRNVVGEEKHETEYHI